MKTILLAASVLVLAASAVYAQTAHPPEVAAEIKKSMQGLNSLERDYVESDGKKVPKHGLKFDRAKADQALAKVRELKQLRTWNNKDDEPLFIAKFIGLKDNQAQFQKPDGKSVSLAPKDLSDEDQAWIRDEVKKRADAEKAAKAKAVATAKKAKQKEIERAWRAHWDEERAKQQGDVLGSGLRLDTRSGRK